MTATLHVLIGLYRLFHNQPISLLKWHANVYGLTQWLVQLQ